MRSGAIGLMAMTGAIIIVLLLSGIFLIENYKKRMKVLKENLYLKEVNMKLTEIHKQEEKLAHQQRLQTIGTLTSGIAHEFSNLLTPIMGYSMMLLQSMEITDENYEDMETIYTSSVKAKEIIDQIASFSGKNIQQTFQNLSASRVVENAVRMVESVRPKAIKLELDMGENASIYGNPTQMQQIILNLCTNAFHAMQDQESGVLKIQTRLTGKKRQKYEITVTDNGCGMDEATQKQIFDPFFTTKKTGEGTGLGLSIVQRIVENHNGTIDVESRLGEGTTFTLKFPIL
ncbi:MAG: sensor histidine kinase [Lachnospiraceae bacterium]